jgi:hypothetical protein
MKTIPATFASRLLKSIKNRLSITLAFALLLGLSASATAATITAGGHAYDVGTGMSPYDQGGYLFFATTPPNTGGGSAGNPFNTSATNNTVSLPGFVSSVTSAGIDQLAWDFMYSQIKPTAASPSSIESGVAYVGNTTGGTEYPLLDINFANTGLPSTVRVGIYVNGEVMNDQSPTALRLENVSNPSDSVSLAVSHAFSGSQPIGGNDLYFFNITPTPGSTYELFGTAFGASPFQNLTIAGLVFAPEPGAFGMFAAGLIGLVAMVRARRRRSV